MLPTLLLSLAVIATGVLLHLRRGSPTGRLVTVPLRRRAARARVPRR